MDLQTHPLSAGRARTGFPGRLAWAMAVSLLAHVLLLWPSATPMVRPLLRGSLRPAPLALSATPAVVPVGPTPTEAPSRITPIRPTAAESKAKMQSRPKAESATHSTAVAGAISSPVPDDPVEQASVVEAESLRSYRLALALNARRFHRYPPQAIEQGLAGTAEVRIAVLRNGLPGRVDLMRSSGHETLDREAREMLARAALATVLPEALRGHAFAVELPVEFSLPAR